MSNSLDELVFPFLQGASRGPTIIQSVDPWLVEVDPETRVVRAVLAHIDLDEQIEPMPTIVSPEMWQAFRAMMDNAFAYVEALDVDNEHNST